MNRKQRRAAKSQGRTGNQSLAGDTLVGQGRVAEAVAQYKSALAADPDDEETCNNLGVALDRLGRLDEAIAQYKRAIALRPDYAEACFNMGVALGRQKKFKDAMSSYERALALRPDYAEAVNNMGDILAEQGRHEEAAAHFKRAFVLRPDYAEACNNLGNVHAALNRFDEAIASYERAIAVKPDLASAHFNLSPLKKYTADDPHLAMMQAVARKAPAHGPGARPQLWFALGKALEDAGRYDDAFAAYSRGNAIRRATLTYDEDALRKNTDDIIRRYDRDFASRRSRKACRDERPVFIVGMPRSGTTLIEQILSSHSGVHGAGELQYLPDLVAETFAIPPGASYMDGLLAASDKDLRKMGERYIKALRALAPRARRICDKLPRNFFYVGLIRHILPEAKIIHAVRDPLDTCFSSYAILFRKQMPFTYDLGELGRYYRQYRRLMDHWKKFLPADAILEVRYEDIVANLDAQARRMVDFCGLGWEDACLAFHENERPVKTASVMQVRQPLYNSSVGRAQHFSRHLQPLKAAIEEDA